MYANVVYLGLEINVERCPQFRSVLIEGFHYADVCVLNDSSAYLCMYVCMYVCSVQA